MVAAPPETAPRALRLLLHHRPHPTVGAFPLARAYARLKGPWHPARRRAAAAQTPSPPPRAPPLRVQPRRCCAHETRKRRAGRAPEVATPPFFGALAAGLPTQVCLPPACRRPVRRRPCLRHPCLRHPCLRRLCHRRPCLRHSWHSLPLPPCATQAACASASCCSRTAVPRLCARPAESAPYRPERRFRLAEGRWAVEQPQRQLGSAARRRQ